MIVYIYEYAVSDAMMQLKNNDCYSRSRYWRGTQFPLSDASERGLGGEVDTYESNYLTFTVSKTLWRITQAMTLRNLRLSVLSAVKIFVIFVPFVVEKLARDE